MKPVSYTIKDGITYFNYNLKEIEAWLKLGKKYGNVGFVLISRENKIFTYEGFGTIENPIYHLHKISLVHFEPLDGPLPTDDGIIKKRKNKKPKLKMLIIMDEVGSKD